MKSPELRSQQFELVQKKPVLFRAFLPVPHCLRPLPNPRLAEIVASLNLDFFQLPAKTVGTFPGENVPKLTNRKEHKFFRTGVDSLCTLFLSFFHFFQFWDLLLLRCKRVFNVPDIIKIRTIWNTGPFGFQSQVERQAALRGENVSQPEYPICRIS